ncbi:APC family permease [Oceanimonas doudoroffii]|uniref:Amino acid permease n=1 Tax=Oceanimonas doudoroffii TaxID=84158 RepID=A0A233RJ20_9GAMM|nr:APC family permease [Oceanimonas doudoroffii]OXY83384.1 amino acid permease [Oceanimonas doudoroffii]
MQKEQNVNKVLTRLDVLFLAFGAMIGWGWVVLSGNWVIEAGTFGAMLAFILGGVLVVFVGLAYAELASAMPTTGGALIYVLRGIGYRPAFVASWALALGYISVVSFEAVALPTVIEYIFPNYKVGFLYSVNGYDVYASWALVGMVGSVFITIVNLMGVKFAALLQMVLTIIIAIIGLMLIFGAAVNGNVENADPLFIGGVAGVLTVAIMTPFMFVGFDVIPQTAEEMKIPPRSIGRILIVSVAAAVIWYVAIIFAVGFGLDQNALISSVLPTADAMSNVFGHGAFGIVLILGGVAGIITSWNSFIIGGSRIMYAMAEKKMLPAWFGRLHPKYGTPVNAILFIGALSTLAPMLGRPMLVWLVNAGGLAIVLAYFLVAVAFVRLRRLEPNMVRPFRAGESNAIGWAAVAFSLLFVALYLPGMPAALVWPYEWLILAGWWGAGFLMMFFMRHQQQAAQGYRYGARSA